MCFSAEASFTSAVLLAIVGYATVTETARKDLKALAVIPWLFALQQFTEGVLWVTLAKGGDPAWIQEIFKWIYLFFAIIFWPIWMPIATITAEKFLVRRKMMALSLIAGVIFASAQLITLFLPETTVTINIVGKSLQYMPSFEFPEIIYRFLQACYIFAAIGPFFFSSLRLMWLYGVVNAATFAVAHTLYTRTFSSVWCFYAAIVSALLFIIIRSNKSEPSSLQKTL
jgi:hypothetical protein